MKRPCWQAAAAEQGAAAACCGGVGPGLAPQLVISGSRGFSGFIFFKEAWRRAPSQLNSV